MSSSLDDREPYEFFQDELDEYLNAYLLSRHLSILEIRVLHTFIEFACFEKVCSSADELSEKALLTEFRTYLQLLYKKSFEEKHIVMVQDFLKHSF